MTCDIILVLKWHTLLNPVKNMLTAATRCVLYGLAMSIQEKDMLMLSG